MSKVTISSTHLVGNTQVSSEGGDTPMAGATLLAIPQNAKSNLVIREDSMKPPPPRAPSGGGVKSGQPTNFAGFLPRTSGGSGVSTHQQSTRPSYLPLSEISLAPATGGIGGDLGLSRSASILPSEPYGGSSSAFFSGLGLGGHADSQSRIPSGFQPGFSASLGGFGVSSSSSSSSAANRGFVFG
jgi:hypothetical protein